MKYVKIIVISVIIGTILTLSTFLKTDYFAPGGVISNESSYIIFYGYPFHWRAEGFTQGTESSMIIWSQLFVDIILWSALSFVILLAYTLLRKK